MLNKKVTQLILVFFIAFGCMNLFPTGVNAEGTAELHWQSNGTTWSYIDTYGNKATGWIRWKGNYYYLDSSGIMAQGWKSVNGKWYYLNPGSGTMATGWLSYLGKWYYLNPNDGAMATGIINDGSKSYWLNPGGDMATGWKGFSGLTSTWYYFKPGSGEMAKGWLYNGGSWYYMNPESGVMCTSWIKSGSSWYYMKSNGVMASNTTINNYYLNYGGAWQPKATRWYAKDGKWYYLNPLARDYEKGWVREGGSGYEKGWISDNGKWYYLNPVTAEMATGWIFDGSKWYYLNPDGAMAYNTTIDGYKLGVDGAWLDSSDSLDYMISLGSSDQDVLSVMLEPTNVETSAPLTKYYYNNSIIYLLDTGDGMMVIGWDNSGNNLKVTTGPASGNTFGLGSTLDDVVSVMGTPKVFDPYYYLGNGRGTYFEYSDGSTVSFEGSFKVDGWSNKGTLKVSAGNKDASAPSIKLGSSLEDIVKVMGTPTSLQSSAVSKLPYQLYYGDTLITLGKDATVAGWQNKNIYDICLGTKDPSAPAIVKGSTLEDVVRAMGTPDEVTPYSANDKPLYLKYGTSYIEMDQSTGLVKTWTNNGNLKVIEDTSDSTSQTN